MRSECLGDETKIIPMATREITIMPCDQSEWMHSIPVGQSFDDVHNSDGEQKFTKKNMFRCEVPHIEGGVDRESYVAQLLAWCSSVSVVPHEGSSKSWSKLVQ